MQLKRWNIRKNATRKEWEQYLAAHKDTQSIPTSLDMPDSTLPLVILGKSAASKKRAKRWVPMNIVEPNAPHASGSRAPRDEARPIPGSSSNEPFAALASIQPDVRDPFLNLADILHGRENTSVYDEPSFSNLTNPDHHLGDPLQDPFDTTGTATHSVDSCLTPIRHASSSADPEFQTLFLGQTPAGGVVSQLANLPVENHMTFFSVLKDANFKRQLPSVQLERNLRYKGFIPNTETGITVFGGFAYQVVAGILSSEDQPMVRKPPYVRHLLRQLGSQVPGESLALITGDQAFETNFVRVLLYSMVNGFAGLGDISMDKILRFLNRFVVNKLLLDILQQLPRYLSRSLADNIFRAAIEAVDTQVVSQLLKYELVHVNDTVCFFQGEKYTPIERAAALGSLKLIKLLIHADADVNKIHPKFVNYSRKPCGALDSLIRGIRDLRDPGWPLRPPESLEALNILIAAGAPVLPRMIIFGDANVSLEFNLLILQNILPEDHREFLEDVFNTAQSLCTLDDEFATTVVRTMIDLCQKAGCNKCLVDFPKFLERVAIRAASVGRTEFVQFLFDKADLSRYLPEIFIAAIASQTPALIDFILSRGPDLDPPATDTHTGRYELSFRTPLAEAVKSGNEALIQKIEAGGCLDHLTQGGRFEAVVYAAAAAGNTAYMRKLLTRGVTSKQAYRTGTVALASAIRGDHQDIVQMLLEAGATQRGVRVDSQLLEWSPGLFHQRHAQTVRVLIASGCDEDEIRKVFLHRGQYPMANLILEYPGMIDEFPNLELEYNGLQDLTKNCIITDRLDLFKEILATSECSHGSLNCCLATAVALGHCDLVGYLLDMGANPFDPGVLSSVIPGRPDMLHLLFQKERRRQTTPKCIGARILAPLMGNGAGNAEALDELIRTDTINFVRLEVLNREYLHLDQGIYNNKGLYDTKLTPLGLAMQCVPGKFDTNMVAMKKFLEAGADPNGISESKRIPNKGSPLLTALCVAVETGREDAVNMLLDYGADVNARPLIRTTRTALQFAAELGNADMVRLLISRGADVNSKAPSHRGATALQFAAMSGNCNIVAHLLDYGAQLDALPSRIDGMWPLEGAAANGRLDMIRFLWELNAMAVMTGTFPDGFSERHCLRAMNFARENGHIGCRDFISELSGISVDRLETDEYGAPWIAYDLPQA